MVNPMKGEKKHDAMRLLYEIQGGVCALCGTPIHHPDWARQEGHLNEPDSPSIEHVLPLSRKGRNTMEYLLLAHRDCNEQRGTGKLSAIGHAMFKRVFAEVRKRKMGVQ